MELLDQHQAAREAIFKYFGYEENWRVLPIDDRRGYLWGLGEHDVRYAETMEEYSDEWSGNHYSDSIYTQRHLEMHIYEGAEYTMILVDTHTDGNQFLAIFDNAKRVQFMED